MEVKNFALIFGWVLVALLVFAFRALFYPLLFFAPCGTCPSCCSKHQISSSLPASKLDCMPQGHVSALPLDAPSKRWARLEGWFPPLRCGRGEVWEELKALRDPRQHYPGLAGARSGENLPDTSFPCAPYLQFSSSFQGLKTPLGELYVRTRLLLGKDQWLSGERCH